MGARRAGPGPPRRRALPRGLVLRLTCRPAVIRRAPDHSSNDHDRCYRHYRPAHVRTRVPRRRTGICIARLTHRAAPFLFLCSWRVGPNSAQTRNVPVRVGAFPNKSGPAFSEHALSAIIGWPEHARQVAAPGALISDQSRLTYNRRDVHHFVHHGSTSRARRSTHAFAYRFVGHGYTPLRQGSFEWDLSPCMPRQRAMKAFVANGDEDRRCSDRKSPRRVGALRWSANRRTPASPRPWRPVHRVELLLQALCGLGSAMPRPSHSDCSLARRPGRLFVDYLRKRPRHHRDRRLFPARATGLPNCGAGDLSRAASVPMRSPSPPSTGAPASGKQAVTTSKEPTGKGFTASYTRLDGAAIRRRAATRPRDGCISRKTAR